MRPLVLKLAGGALIAVSLGAGGTVAQQPSGTVESHRAAAKAAAGSDHPTLYARLCPDPSAQRGRSGGAAAPAAAPGGRGGAQRGAGAAAPAGPRPAPPREQWYAEPVKVFDNLYFVGQTEYSAWAVSTSDGIVVIDTIFDYSVEAEVVDGLKKLGLDPAQIKYVIVSHGHGDHSGGARYLQERFGARVIMGAPDWDLMARTTPALKKDMVAADGQKLTLGDTTLTLYLTPGHTAGTISTLIPVKDNGKPHLMATWGGTLFNFGPNAEIFKTYANSAARFRGIVAKAGADGILSNHTEYDESKRKLPALAKRRPGDPHPYVIGANAVQRYLTVAEECARAALLGLGQ